MRLILIGQAVFAEKVLDGVRDKGHDVVAVYCPPDGPSGKPDPVKARAQALATPVFQHASLKSPEVRAEFESLKADLAVLAYVTQIVPQSLFEIPRLGSICFHPSLLPKFRGGSAIPWQIIKGETDTGVTVFWVDPGIDTGPILLQKPAVIDPDDTAASLYFNKLFGIGVEAVIESVESIAMGKAPRIPQDESKASYDPLCRDDHASIDWSRPLNEVYNLLRGCDPQPGAYTMWQGEKLRLFDCRKIEGSGFAAGVVAEVSVGGMVVGAAGGAICAKRARLGTAAKALASEVAASCGINPGRRLPTAATE